MNKFNKIKEHFHKHLKKFSEGKNFDSFYNLGIDFYNKKDYEKAIRQFKLALEKPRVQPQVYYNLGLAYQCMKNYEKAIINYKRFLALHHDDHDGLYNLALTYYLMEKYDKSTEIFEKCIKIKKDEDGIKALVLSYLCQDESQKVMDLADKVLQIPDEGIKLYYAIAKTFENKHSINKDFTYIDTAIKMYMKIAEIDPNYFNSYLSISICYAKKGEWEKSVEFCKKALKTNPDSYEANNQMGLVYYCCDEIEKAVEYYETALRLKPKGDYKIYSNLAYAYEKEGEKDKAIKIFTQLINKFPDYPARDEIKNHLRILKTLDLNKDK